MHRGRSIERPLVALLLLASAAACGKGAPEARTDDLWPRLRRAPAKALPTAAEVERACSEAFAHFKEEAEKTPGTYIDPTYFDYPVRNPQCRAEPGAASTLNCRFEQSEVMIQFPSVEERAAEIARMKDKDWTPHEVRLVFVAGALGEGRWIAPAGCKPVPPPAP